MLHSVDTTGPEFNDWLTHNNTILSQTKLKLQLPQHASLVSFSEGDTDLGNTDLIIRDWVDVVSSEMSGLHLADVCLVHNKAQWGALSYMQKGIRRSEKDWCYIAASGLTRSALLSMVWRRLAVIGMEDLGLCGLHATALTLHAINRTDLTEQQEIRLLRGVLLMMAQAVKDRSVMDVASAISCKATTTTEVSDYVDKLSVDDLLDGFTDQNFGLIYRTLCHRKLLRHKYHDDLHAAYQEIALPQLHRYVIAKYRELKKFTIDEALPVVWDVATRSEPTVKHNHVSKVVWCGDAPSCCYDMFTSDGKRAMSYFRKANSEVKNFFDGRLVEDFHNQFGYGLFAVDGGILDRSLHFAGRDTLAYETLVEEFSSVGMSALEAIQLGDIIEKHLDEYNAIRKKLITSNLFTEC
jgi:hypothetical protein